LENKLLYEFRGIRHIQTIALGLTLDPMRHPVPAHLLLRCRVDRLQDGQSSGSQPIFADLQRSYLTFEVLVLHLGSRSKGEYIYQSTELYKHTLFRWALPYCASQTLQFLQIEGLWQPYLQEVFLFLSSSHDC
jgi:hypothetical protein